MRKNKIILYCGAIDSREIKTTDLTKFNNFMRGSYRKLNRYYRFEISVPEDRLESTISQDMENLREYYLKINDNVIYERR